MENEESDEYQNAMQRTEDDEEYFNSTSSITESSSAAKLTTSHQQSDTIYYVLHNKLMIILNVALKTVNQITLMMNVLSVKSVGTKLIFTALHTVTTHITQRTENNNIEEEKENMITIETNNNDVVLDIEKHI